MFIHKIIIEVKADKWIEEKYNCGETLNNKSGDKDARLYERRNPQLDYQLIFLPAETLPDS